MKHLAAPFISAPAREAAGRPPLPGAAPGLTQEPLPPQCNGRSGAAPPVKILVVEDEPKTAATLRQGLNERGYEVELAGDGVEGLSLVTQRAYDLLILDIMLPIQDGWTVLTGMRQAGLRTPVMCLTALDAVPDRVRGLELGADDYVVKPFAFSELLARVRSLLRRGRATPNGILVIADLEIDQLRYRVTRAGRAVPLSPKEFALLLLLAQRSGEVLSRTLIAEQVWNMNFDSDTNVVDVAIRRLRSKVDDPFAEKLIHAVRGMGYVLESR